MATQNPASAALFSEGRAHPFARILADGRGPLDLPGTDEPFHVIIGSTGMVDIPSLTGGGVEAYVWDLARILAGAGHDVTLVTNLRTGFARPADFEVASSRSFVDRFPLPPLSSAIAHGFGGSFTAAATRKVVRSNGTMPAVLHLNEEVSSALLCRRYPGLPKLFTIHNPPPIGDARSYGLLERTVRWVNTSVCRRLIWNQVDIIVALSSWIRDFVVANGTPPERVVHLPLPIDTDLYRPSSDSDKVQEPYLLYVGRLDSRKNVVKLVEAMARTAGPTRLRIVGRGPAESLLLDTVRRNALASKVVFHGRVSHDALLRLYQGASALCLPSTLEAYPRVVLEAAACGVPSILPDCFLYTDFRDAGFVQTYDPARPDGLRESIDRLLAEPTAVRALGRRAREYAVGTSSYPAFRAALESAYRAAFAIHAAR